MKEEFNIGDSVQFIKFQDRIESKQRLRIVTMTDNDYEAWLLTKDQTFELVKWLDELLLRKDWK